MHRVLELLVVAAEDKCLACRGLREPEQQPQGRRLAGSVGPEEAGDRPPLERERERLHGRDLAVSLGEVPRAEDRPAERSREVSIRQRLVDGRSVVARFWHRPGSSPPATGRTWAARSISST